MRLQKIRTTAWAGFEHGEGRSCLRLPSFAGLTQVNAASDRCPENIQVQRRGLFFIRLVMPARNRRAGSELTSQRTEEAFMTKWFAPALLAVILMFGGSAAIKPAVATPVQAAAQARATSQATDISARRRYRHHRYRYVYRPYYRPYYYARPYYYRPYPYYAPAPFVFGFGFGPWWW